jgi:hypothetical protein
MSGQGFASKLGKESQSPFLGKTKREMKKL